MEVDAKASVKRAGSKRAAALAKKRGASRRARPHREGLGLTENQNAGLASKPKPAPKRTPKRKPVAGRGRAAKRVTVARTPVKKKKATTSVLRITVQNTKKPKAAKPKPKVKMPVATQKRTTPKRKPAARKVTAATRTLAVRGGVTKKKTPKKKAVKAKTPKKTPKKKAVKVVKVKVKGRAATRGKGRARK